MGDDYVEQEMFKCMYKYDLALDDAFEAWKEDESEAHEAGKMKTIIVILLKLCANGGLNVKVNVNGYLLLVSKYFFSIPYN